MAMCFSLPGLAQGQFVQPRRAIDGDVTTRIYNVFNCQTNIVSAVNGSAGRGTITTRNAKQNRCGNRGHDVVEVMYTPQRGYRGPDEADIFWGGGRTRIHLNVR
jgi:hypothetical protein